MTVFEQHTHKLIQSACRKVASPYDNCKVKIFNSFFCKSFEDYEKVINEFLSNNHNIVDIKVTQCDVSYVTYIFYKE
jgi:hypothetical protein